MAGVWSLEDSLGCQFSPSDSHRIYFSCLHLPFPHRNTGVTDACALKSGFFVGSGHGSSGLHSCTASALPHEQTSPPPTTHTLVYSLSLKIMLLGEKREGRLRIVILMNNVFTRMLI